MKQLLLIALLLITGANVSAQKNDYSIWKDFGSNCYIDAGGGIQTLFTPDWKELSFGKQLTPSFYLGVGKWINPFWGVHASVHGYSYNGYRAAPIGDPEPFSPLNNVDLSYEGAFRYYLRYMGVRADIQFSLLNMIAGRERENRIYDLVPYLGFGYMHSFAYRGTTKENLLTGHLGLRNRFSVCRQLDVNLDVVAQISDNYMHPVKWKYATSLALNVGVSYYFGHRAFRKSVVNVPVEATRYLVDTVYVREVEVPGKERIIERVVSDRTDNLVMASIRFDLNGIKPLKGQETQIFEVARFLNSDPEASIIIEGYADATSGSEKYNKKLGYQRAESIKQILVQKYNVNAKQITTEAIGANEQPYKDYPLWNCVAIIKLVK